MNEPVRFYMDEHVSPAVTQGLIRRGVDVLTAREARLLGAEDEDHLGFARQEGRVIFSQDTDFLRLHAAGHPHAGIVYAPQQTPVGRIVSGLKLIHDLLTPEEMANHVEFL